MAGPMSTDTNRTPSEAARETLKRLTMRKLAPTPENFTEVYEEIVGSGEGGSASTAARMLERLAVEFSGAGESGAQLAGQVQDKNWPQVHKLLAELARGGGHGGKDAPDSDDWGGLVRRLLRELEMRHAGWTTARKRDSLERVLEVSGGDAARLRGRLERLIRSWAEVPAEATPSAAVAVDAQEEAGSAAGAALPVMEADAEIPGMLRELTARTLRMAVGHRMGGDKQVIESAEQLAERLRHAQTVAQINQCAAELKNFWLKFDGHSREQDDIQQAMLRLINLLLENVGELLSDDSWLKGQIGMLRDLVAAPISPLKLKDAERKFKDVLLKQGVMRRSMDDHKAALKTMLAAFIERLGALTESTGGFGDRIEGYATRIRETNDLSQLDGLLSELMQETRGMRADVLRSHDELLETRKKVHDYEDRIRALEQELSQVSEKVREDQLTQTLNRRGLEETFDVELARCSRKQQPLCLALLDIDNFKQLNDRFGHKTGDDALVHLVAVIRETVRPSDSVARFGGEEFIIVLPEAGLEEAVSITSRVQRVLTRRFFLANNQRILITFSAGVALHDGTETRDAVIARADAALYQAKRAGKNRVIAAS
jgi:diguanylate cyclase